MSDMNYDELKRMQQAAQKRVSEMDKRARSAVNSFNGSLNRPPQSNAPSGFTPVREVPSPKYIKMPVEFPERTKKEPPESGDKNIKPHFIYEPPNGSRSNGAMKTNVYGKSGFHGESFFGNLSRDDTERLFLLSLCLLLKNENADGELITALMYIMT